MACVTDHFMPNTKEREGAMLECWSTLTALSTLVPRIQVGTIVLGNTYRHPAVVAKMAAQVDIISGGRLLLGLGAGWQQNEHEAYGIPFYTMRERLERLDEACQVMRSLWTQDRSDFKGRYYQLSDAPLQPKPVQKPHPELMIGGGGERVTLLIGGPLRGSLECLGRAEGPGPQGPDPRRALRRPSGAIPRPSRRSVNMALLITDKKEEVERSPRRSARGWAAMPPTRATPAWPAPPIRSASGCSSSRRPAVASCSSRACSGRSPELRRDLDRFIAEIAPAFR